MSLQIAFGTVPDWLIAAGSVGALIFAAAAARAAGGQLEALKLQNKAAQEEAASRETTRIFERAARLTWYCHERPREGAPVLEFIDAAERGFNGQPPGRDVAFITIVNSNPEVVYEVSVQVGRLREPPRTLGTELRLSRPLIDEDHSWRQVGALPPGEHTFRLPLWHIREHEYTPTLVEREFAFIALNLEVQWVEFRDTSGRIWRRWNDGLLEQQADRPPYRETAYSI